MNKTHLQSFLALASVIFMVSACKTSGDLRSRRQGGNYRDPVVTEEAGPKGPSHDELERELAITRGKLAESEELHRRDRLAFEERIKTLETQNNELLGQIAQVQGQAAAAGAPKVEAGSANASGFALLWNQALKDVSQKNYEASESLFAEMLKGGPKGDRAFYAFIGLAFSQYSSGRFKEAAITFNDVLDKFPKHKRLSLAWFGQGAAFEQIGQAKDSRLFYSEAARSSPQSREGKLAGQILAKKAKAPRDLFLAFPHWNGSAN
jgi:TolA-binding protein